MKRELPIGMIILLAFTSIANAQLDFGKLSKGLNLSEAAKEVTVTAEFEVAEGTDRGRVNIKAIIADQWHLYSVTQPAGGAKRMRIKMADGSSAELAGPFTPNVEPHKSESDVFKGVTIEEHDGEVIWTAPLKFATAESASQAKVELVVDGQACRDGACLPVRETLTASFKGTYQPPKPAGEFREEGSKVKWNAWIEPSGVRPGDDAKLMIVASIDEGYHIFEAATEDTKFSTVFVATKKSGVRLSAPVTTGKPIHEEATEFLPELSYHEKQVGWTVPVEVEKTAELGEHPIEVLVAYQECDDGSCQQRGLKVSGQFVIGKELEKAPAPLAMSAIEYRDVVEASIENPQWVDKLSANENATPSNDVQQKATMSLPLALFFGLVGGLILNLMPCVLPVIGLKVMSFVEQAGQDRGRILTLNLWYSLGLLSVFWILACVVLLVRWSSGDSFAWGQQYTYFSFRLGLMIFVFAMALSFLGTWEIPLPGFASGGAAGDLQKKEGASGAFAKGMFSTILATPCSGPFLGPVFGFMLTQSEIVVFTVFTAIGIGMALPYLAIGIFPSLISALPKPGEWMETMKQGLAFFLLGTVVYLFAGVPEKYRSAVFGVLMAVWFGCWIIGRVPNWQDLQKRLSAWGTGISVAVLLSMLMFHLLVPGAEIMKWEKYSESKLTSLQGEGKTVMLDFTANWCPTCILNFNNVLNTESMAKVLAKHDVVAMKADWSEPSEEIQAKLNELQAASIPLLVIYPADDPTNPIVLPDLLTSNQVTTAIQKATGKAAQSQADASQQTAMR